MKKKLVLIAAAIALSTNLPSLAAEPANGTAVASEAQLTALEGTYELAPTFKIKVWLESGHLMAQATGQGAFELFAESGDTFFAKVAPMKFVFKRNDSGAVTQFILQQGGKEQPAMKVS